MPVPDAATLTVSFAVTGDEAVAVTVTTVAAASEPELEETDSDTAGVEPAVLAVPFITTLSMLNVPPAASAFHP